MKMGKAKPKFKSGDRCRIREADHEEGVHTVNVDGIKNGFLCTVVSVRREIVFLKCRRHSGVYPAHYTMLEKVKE